MTEERYRLLRHVRALGRQYRRVHADVIALEHAGLLARSNGSVRATTDTIRADLRL
jgi:hypothetical protein